MTGRAEGKTEKKTAVVTGSSSGIGYAVCSRLRAEGYAVYGISRRGKAPEGCIGIKADVCNEKEVTGAVENIISEQGRIDLLVNNAGSGIAGPVEFADTESVRYQMDVNFMGQFHFIKAVLPHMRKRRSGSIVCISSVAGQIAIPFQGFYSASKAAVISMALALRNEVGPFGIKVCAVLPGDVSTGFTDARKINRSPDVYTRAEKSVASMEKDERGGMPPEKIAGDIVKAAVKRSPRPIYISGGKYRLFSVLFSLLPSRLSYYIVGKMY